MVVAQREVREVAVQVEHDVAVDIHEEVASALLGVDEAVHLQARIGVKGLSGLEGRAVLRARESRLDLGLCVLIRVLEPQEAYPCFKTLAYWQGWS